MATRHVLAELASAAEAAGFGTLTIESLGGVDAARRVASGEPFDLVFLAADALERLAGDGHVAAASLTPLVLSQVAAAVPSGSTEPAAAPAGAAFADAEGLRAALRAAHRIGYSTGPSGTALVGMIEGWGLSAEIGDRLVQARPGVQVATLVADGEADLGLQQLSELVGSPGVRILGVLPEDCAIDTVFSGAVATSASDPALAAGALAFLASAAVAPIKTAHSFGVPGQAG